MNEIIRANWIILTPIVFLSVIGVAVIVERSLYFYRIRVRSQVDLAQLLRSFPFLSLQSLEEQLKPSDRSPVRALLESAVSSKLKRVPTLYRESLEAIRDRHLDRMERYMGILPGIGNLATLVGLFGTVSGMITAFSRMTESGSSDPYILAGGISRALITTAAGLAVAIPVILAHHCLETFIDRHAEQLEEILSDCVAASGVYYARSRQASKNKS